jgi:NADH dehydrogenase FAD-containing subunit
MHICIPSYLTEQTNYLTLLLPCHSSRVRDIVERILREKGIAVHLGANVCGLEAHHKDNRRSSSTLIVSDGRRIPCHEVFWCTQASAQRWMAESGVECDEDGFVRVQVLFSYEHLKNTLLSFCLLTR